MNKKIGLMALLGMLGAFGFSESAGAESYTNTLPVGIWDLSGTYSQKLNGLDVGYTVEQDGKGKITGTGYAEADIDGVSIVLNFAVKGKIKSKNGVYAIAQKISAKATAEVNGKKTKFKATYQIKAEINTGTGMLSGTMKVSALGEKISVSFLEPLADENMDGTSVLITTLSRTTGKVVGDALLTLSNGRIIYGDVKGKDGKNGLKVKAKGEKTNVGSKGMALQLIFGDSGELKSVKGKVSGQKAAWSGSVSQNPDPGTTPSGPEEPESPPGEIPPPPPTF
ncbi:hypothetical protein [Pontiella sulfatireligans]|nr:hypothetical protein [Pontiella sulfatireligans]